jgi:hypothetical protein
MADMDVLDGSEEISVNKGDTVFASVSLANVDVSLFLSLAWDAPEILSVFRSTISVQIPKL